MASLPQAPLALIPSRHLVYHAPPSLTISLLTDVVGSPPPSSPAVFPSLGSVDFRLDQPLAGLPWALQQRPWPPPTRCQ